MQEYGQKVKHSMTKGLGPIPSRWKGHCQSSTNFDPAKACNRKLIGAKFSVRVLKQLGRPAIKDPDFPSLELTSPRDRNGHGTHTSSTAGGSFTPNASYFGLGYGTVRGGAPKARIATYKVCWNWLTGGCTFAVIMMAIDEAIHDGVDILSLSLGLETPQYADVDMRSGIGFASFHAVTNGITVVCSGGNEGPYPQTVEKTSPWTLTVAASSIDRSFPTLITLGNNWTFAGQSLYTGKETCFISIAHPESSDLEDKRQFYVFKGVFITSLLQSYNSMNSWILKLLRQEVGGLGLIVAKNPTRTLDYFASDFPSIGVSIDVGAQLLDYIKYSRKPQVKLSPNSVAPAILKPDIAAPGVNILAAIPPEETPHNSMANRPSFWGTNYIC
ncbi:hypothetical protein K7X08_024910 [Anisodus acutangulus]|uniref:Peptidase S8/S53 domain-containing protein n=1 Tax=Anisodus acutangulus TaxID=402998 RepID=A0A9Q1MAT5_9SOLA|nr:hypothetical protein K7X08_024910 [Anisodus acutangulus]